MLLNATTTSLTWESFLQNLFETQALSFFCYSLITIASLVGFFFLAIMYMYDTHM